jgi:hypothetical protein
MRSPTALPAVLALLPFGVYARFIAGDELYNPDVFLAYRPVHAFLAEGLRHGRIPLWTDALLGGFPIAFSEYGWFSPLTLAPLLVFGGHAGFYVAVALCVALSGLWAHVLLRQLGASRAGALLGGLIYGQSLFVVGGAPLLNQGAAYWALPATLWCVGEAFAGHRHGAPLLGIAVALVLLGSHPQLSIIALAPGAMFALWRSVSRRDIATLARLAAGAVLGGAVSALRFLPTLPLVAASERAGGLALDASAIGSVAPHALLGGWLAPSLTIPRYLSPQWTAYVGALPLALALAAPRRVNGGWWALVLSGVVLALGSFTPIFWALQRTPLLTYFREPSRFLLWTVLGMAVLAVRGLERVAYTPRDRRVRAAVRVALFGVAPALAAAGVTFGLRVVEPRAVEWLYLNTVRQVTVRDYPQEHYLALASGAWHSLVRSFDPLDAGLLVPLVSLAAAAVWWAAWRGRRRDSMGAVLCSALPLLAYGQLRLPAIPRDVVAERPTAIETQDERPAPRVLSWLPLAADFENRTLLTGADLDANMPSYRLLKRLLAPNFGLAYGAVQLDGYENLMTREQAVLTAALGSERTSTPSPLALTRQRLPERRRLGGERWGLIEAAGVATVLSVERIQPSFWPAASRYEPAAVRAERGVPSVTAFRLTHPAPRAYVASAWRIVESADDAVRLLAGDEVDGLPATVLTAGPADVAGAGVSPVRPRATGPARPVGAAPSAEIVRYEERLVEVVASADTDALLVLLDANVPGWTATVTGAPAPILTANVAFRAVPIPAGRHVVRFEYEPPGWRLGVALSAVAALLLGSWAAWAAWMARVDSRAR